MAEPERPAVRWHGGKWLLAPWIISHFPPHRIYVEPFGGAASVLLRKARSYAEVYNDLDDSIVNLFRVMQHERQAARLHELLRLTPFARREFELARDLDGTNDPVEQARRLIVRSFMGFGSNAHNGRATGFRANSNRRGTTPAYDWAHYPDALPALIERFRSVVIEHRDAATVMAAHDGPQTLHYIDPPYVPDTRSKHRMYRHELDLDGHAKLLEFVKGLEGMVVLSGYSHALYDEALAGWMRVERKAFADGARPRIEVLWINQSAWEAATPPLLRAGETLAPQPGTAERARKVQAIIERAEA